MSSGPNISRRARKSPAREFTLPADVDTWVTSLPDRQRSAVAAAALRLARALPPEALQVLVERSSDGSDLTEAAHILDMWLQGRR